MSRLQVLLLVAGLASIVSGLAIGLVVRLVRTVRRRRREADDAAWTRTFNLVGGSKTTHTGYDKAQQERAGQRHRARERQQLLKLRPKTIQKPASPVVSIADRKVAR